MAAKRALQLCDLQERVSDNHASHSLIVSTEKLSVMQNDEVRIFLRSSRNSIYSLNENSYVRTVCRLLAIVE